MFNAGIPEKNNPKLGFVVFIKASLSDGVYIRFIFSGLRVYTLVKFNRFLDGLGVAPMTALNLNAYYCRIPFLRNRYGPNLLP